MRIAAQAVVGGVLFCAVACASNPVSPAGTESCTGFGNWETSLYVLPYPSGASYTVDQGNCSSPGNGHTGVRRFGYDFLMPIGSAIIAARTGTVVQVEASNADGDIASSGRDNYVVIEHADGTTALYGHLTRNGAVVSVGDVVEQGAAIGQSGNTGNTGNKPHLHFSVQSCDPVSRGTDACATLPVNFRNTLPNPQGLATGQAYRAQ